MLAMRNWTRGGMAGLVIGIFGAATASAEPIAWTAPASGSWHTPGNWDLNRVPLNTDAVTIALDGTYTVTISSGAVAQSLTLGGASGTQTLVISGSGTELTVATHATVLAQGVLELNRTSGTVFITFPAVGGTLTNSGTVRAVGGTGNIHLQGDLNNQGLFTVQGPDLQLGIGGRNHVVTNSGTIDVTAGAFSAHFGGGFYQCGLNLTNTGTFTVAAGAFFRHGYGPLTLSTGAFGGGGLLILYNSTVNLPSDFHTGDWGSISASVSTINGPGVLINDAPGGFDPSNVTFNTLVDNRSTLSTYIGSFNAGLLNPAAALLRILGNNNSTETTIAGGFTNNGTVHIISRGAALSVTGGTLVNNGLIEARREGSPQGTRSIYANIDNHGTITNVDVSDLRLGGGGQILSLNNSGTINVTGGDLSNWEGVVGVGGNDLTFTNTGTVAIAPGRTYRQRGGALNLNAGTFGGPGANLFVNLVQLNHTADFHTGDWASCPGYQTTYNGPGKFVNDHPTGYIGDCPSGGPTTFNTLVQNKTHFTSRGCYFTSGFENPIGATLRIGSNAGFSQVTTRFLSGFTNHGVIEIVDWGATLATIGPAPNLTMRTLTNSPTGQIHVRRLGTPQSTEAGAGRRILKSHIANHGVLTVHDTDLLVGEGNYFMQINNYGFFNLTGGNLVFGNGPLNQAWINNYGVLNIGEGRTINEIGGDHPPLLFINKPGAILSGSGTIFGGDGGPNAFNKFEINGVVRPGGENAVGTLHLAGSVFVPGDPAQIGAIVELDIGAPGAQADDQLLAGLVAIPDQGGRYLSVNVLGSNVPPPGSGIPLDNVSPYVASNLTVFDGGICVGCLGGGPGTACGGTATVLAACPGPTITQQPQSIAPCPGDTISLSVVATGADPLTYQWQRITTSVVNLANGPTGNGSTISGADGPTLTISSLAVNDLGSYAVVVSDANGSRISTLATLVGGCVINVTAATPQPFLDSLVTPAATIVMQNVPDRPTLILPALTSLGGAMHVIGNGGLTNLQAALLATIGGGLDVRNNPLLTDVTLPALTTVTGDLDVSGNTAATGIDFPQLGSVGGEVTIHNNPLTTMIDFPQLGSVGGELAIHNNPLTTTIDFPQLGSVGGEVTIHNNPAATVVGLGSLQTVVGSVSIRDNLALAAISMPLLTDVDGGVEVSGNTSASTIDMSSLGSVGGSVAINDNTGASAIDVGALGSVGGSVAINDNTTATTIDLSTLGGVGGSIAINDNTAATTIDLGSLGSAGGNVDVTGNPGASTIDLGSLGSAGGNVNVTGNPGASTIDLSTLGSAGGNVNVTGNPGASTIDLGSLGSAGGNVNVTGNPGATEISLDSLTDVGGDLTLETQGQPDVDLSGAAVAGDTDVSSTGATSVEVQTPGGTTSVEMCNDAACMDADLPDNAAPDGTAFAILRVDPQTLGRVPGLDETGQPAGVDPVAAYAFTLGAPLQGAASLVFDLTLAGLSAPEQAAVLDAYSDGRLTLTVQGDNPGDAPQARAQCGPADPLVADGCVKVGAFDALGFQLPPGVTAGAVTIRIAALVSHFSTYAVSIVTGRGDMNCDGEIDLADVEPFVQALTDPAGYTAAHPACPAMGADMNQDGAANGLDIARFTAAVLPTP